MYILGAYKSCSISGEHLWLEFITALRPHSIKSWPRSMIISLAHLLLDREVHVEAARGTNKAQSLIDLRFRDAFMASSGPSDPYRQGATRRRPCSRQTAARPTQTIVVSNPSGMSSARMKRAFPFPATPRRYPRKKSLSAKMVEESILD